MLGGIELWLPRGVLGDDGDGALNNTTQGAVTLVAALAVHDVGVTL